MAEVCPKTIGESLYWSYANFVMAVVALQRRDSSYQKLHYIIRRKTYYGLLRGTMKIGSFFNDEVDKIAASEFCCYCGSQDDLTLDHMIPRMKCGSHSADNLVRACRSCNSSKHARDLLEWMAAKQEFPPLVVLRRYLKIVIAYCVENTLMDVLLREVVNLNVSSQNKQPTLWDIGAPRADATKPDPPLPFSIALIPHRYPDLVDLAATEMGPDVSLRDIPHRYPDLANLAPFLFSDEEE